MISVPPWYRVQHPSLAALRVSFCACFYTYEVVGYQLPEGEKLGYKGPVMAQLSTAYPSPVCYDWFCPKHITPGLSGRICLLKGTKLYVQRDDVLPRFIPTTLPAPRKTSVVRRVCPMYKTISPEVFKMKN